MGVCRAETDCLQGGHWTTWESLSMQKERAVLENIGLLNMYTVKDTGLEYSTYPQRQTLDNNTQRDVMSTVIGYFRTHCRSGLRAQELQRQNPLIFSITQNNPAGTFQLELQNNGFSNHCPLQLWKTDFRNVPAIISAPKVLWR